MKVTLETAELLGNPKFCTAQEAIDFAQKEVGFPRWNDNYSVSENIRFFGEGNELSKRAWSVVLARPDISPEEALDYMEKSEMEEVFGSVLKREDISLQTALEYTENYSLGVSFWRLFLKRKDLSLQQVFSLIEKSGSELNHILVVNAVFERDDIKDLSFNDLFGYLEKIDLNYFWGHLSKMSSFLDYLLNENTPTEILFSYVKNLSFSWFRDNSVTDYEKTKKYSEITSSLLLRKDFNYKRAVAFLEKIFMCRNEHDYTGNELRMAVLIKRTDIPVGEVVHLAKEWEIESILEAVMKREDVKEYLSF